MQRILLSLSLITLVIGAIGYGATNAFFSDTEISASNIFAAGAIDLKVDNESYYNGVPNPDTTWGTDEPIDLENDTFLFFDFDDVKPDDYGEDTISLHVLTNDAYLCANVTLTSNDDNGCTEPEGLPEGTDTTCDDPGPDQGELAELVNFIWWADDGDNVLEEDETVINTGNFGQLGVGNSYPIALADSDENIWTGVGGPVPGQETQYIGKAWCFGAIGEAPLEPADYNSPIEDNDNNQTAGEPEDGGYTCEGTDLGNESQTDSLTADISFSAVQARHNEDFQCEAFNGPRTTLTLVKQLLTQDGAAPTDWVLSATGLTPISGVTGSPEVTNVVIEPGTYDLSETGLGGYGATNWSCNAGNQIDEDTIEIAEGENVTCKISNYLACDPAQAYADRVVSFDQGVSKNPLIAIAPNRSDPTKALGMPQSSGAPYDNPVAPLLGQFFSLGFDEGTDDTPNEGGWIEVEFVDNYIVDGPGNDLRMWEITGGSNYPVEKLKIEVSKDGVTWYEVASSLQRDAEADLFSSGITWARYVRLTDVSNRAEFSDDTADGYDLDAFSALTCADRTFIPDQQ